MSIGEVLKQARSEADLSQEDVAEKVGVSRQTISSWENGRSYPDIASVITLSDTYNVSLDSLMKGDSKMIKHLEESTNVAKSNKQVVATIIAIAIFLVGTALVILTFGGDIGDFVDLPSWLAIIIPILVVLAVTKSFRTFGTGFQAALFPKKEITDGLKKQAASLFRLLSVTSALSGIIMTLIGITNMLYSIENYDENIISIFSINLAVSMITILYSLFLIIFIFEPIVYILKKEN
ncbi:MAG: helix-turn-helix domain-containing protein [Oscillospiraceae bacterium]|jgi:transcriptional regulator with XRE-family HTH domain|nr:helix-turn-helix domain-containing protein [Oscillospiraceae bacterium]